MTANLSRTIVSLFAATLLSVTCLVAAVGPTGVDVAANAATTLVA